MNGVQVTRYELDFSATWLNGFLTREPPHDWRPQPPGETLERRLPVPWPSKFVTRWKQSFAPQPFFVNALAICNYRPRTDTEDAWVAQLGADLYERLLKYTEATACGRFVVNRFDRTYGDIRIASPWASAYSNGAALIGLCRLAARFPDGPYLRTAHEIFEAFLAFRDPPDTRLWISFIDPDGYVWFEEQPLQGEDEQPRILNGHIRAIDGLFHFARATGRQDATDLVHAGITTVQHYVLSYRRPGHANSYELRNPDIADYSLVRTVQQQRYLHKLTGEPFFAETAEMFAADLRGSKAPVERATGQVNGPAPTNTHADPS